jgi:hypothetical protein
MTILCNKLSTGLQWQNWQQVQAVDVILTNLKSSIIFHAEQFDKSVYDTSLYHFIDWWVWF